MADDPVNADAPAETPSGEDAPDELSETPSDELEPGDEPGDDEPPADEPDGADDDADADAPDDEEDADPTDEPPTDPAERRAWNSLEDKFKYIKDPEDRKNAVANAYWNKATYAKEQRIRAEKAEAKLARLEAERDLAKPPEQPEEEPPHPDVERIDAAIQALVTRSNTIQDGQKVRLTELRRLDIEKSVCDEILKTNTYEDQKPVLEARKRSAETEYNMVREAYLAANEKLGDYQEKYDQLKANRDWVVKFNSEQAQRKQREQQELEKFNADFPKEVDTLINEAADELKLPEDKRIRASLWRNVNPGLIQQLRRAKADEVEDVDLKGMVTKLVKEFAEDRDLIGRKAFKEKSDKKLDVTTRSGVAVRKAATPPSTVPAYKRPPVPAALLSGDTTPGMRRARERLVKRFDGS